MGAPHGQATMFTSSNTFSIDESKLCFNKTHFNREDFNVERFMNLARQKADLKTIQQDLRLYLKSVQNSMIELINDDYADFVHLSSNLVSLQESLNKIEQEINRNWNEFEESTKESVGMAGRIEQKCNELGSNREKQSELRDRISFLCSIEKLAEMLQRPPQKCSVLWLQKAANFVVELKATSSSCHHSEEEKNAEITVISKLEAVLCTEGVRSASTDCQNLPLILSILSLIGGAHSLTALLVSDLLYTRFVVEIDGKEVDRLNRLEQVYENVINMRQTWAEKLGAQHFREKIRSFLDDTLLTFILTFIDKCMATVAVPSDTRLFHKCFSATQHFIDTWPSASSCRTMLKSIRDKFNLTVYFKLETQRFGKKIEQLLIPEKFESNEHENNDEELYFETSRTIFAAIEHVWSDEVYLAPIVDKLWDFTLRMLLKHYSWSEAMRSYFIEQKKDWTLMLLLHSDAGKLHQSVFDFALETIWGKLHDLSVETAPFGQCLTKHGRAVDSLCHKIDEDIVRLFADILHLELSQVSDVPKQYRWTKRAPPTSHSKYATNAVEMIYDFQSRIEKQEHPDVEKVIKSVSHSAFHYFIGKAKEVQDGVEATGSSLSRFKKKATPDVGSAVTDDDKIKQQIYHDAKFLLESAEKLNVSSEDIEGLGGVVNRFEIKSETIQEDLSGNNIVKVEDDL
ncbi:CRE-COGC-2 protein [Caenorhabditis remanei]|uniref:Conserved oligomeric Golgi complex subunit 2 n=1 Tax=Caenorhabditis remanei TaxID=31234 RepID=E3MK88_CAERE|nr:CRE-COGC-2 protein [Caenorhabditis remanei]